MTDNSDENKSDLLDFPENEEMQQITNDISAAREETPTFGQNEEEKEASRPNLAKYSSFRGIRARDHSRDDESLSDYLSNSLHGSIHGSAHGAIEEVVIQEKTYEPPKMPEPQKVIQEKPYEAPKMPEPPQQDEDTSVSSDSNEADNQAEAQRKVHLPTSIRIRVLESWELVEQDLDQLGMDFFLTIFRKHPQMKDLFRFGGTKTEDLPKNAMLQAHANGVMKTVGVALAGLEDVEALIPVLRNLGLRHSQVGVMPEHYDVIYGILISTIKKHVGKDKWSKEIEQAWQVCYGVIASVMKDPSRHLEVEPAEGWGMWNGLVCAYLAIATPVQLAGFGSILLWRIVFQLLNLVAIATCVLDGGSGYLQRVVSLKNSTGKSFVLAVLERFRWWFPLKFRIHRIIRRLRLSRWTPWASLDLLVLSSFVVSFMLPSGTPQSLVYFVGMVRILALARSVHVVRCAELLSLKKPGARKEYFHFVQLAQLGMALCYMIHLFGCMHCMVIQLSGDEAERFSPALRMLGSNTDSFNKYLHGVYWGKSSVSSIFASVLLTQDTFLMMQHILCHYLVAFVNVAGIGT